MTKKMDFATWFYLFCLNLKVEKHEQVEDVKKKITFSFDNVKSSNNIYVFKDYKEFKNFFLMYLDNVNEDILKSLIFSKSKSGHIIAFKSLCQYYIVESLIRKLCEENCIPNLEIEQIIENKELFVSSNICSFEMPLNINPEGKGYVIVDSFNNFEKNNRVLKK